MTVAALYSFEKCITFIVSRYFLDIYIATLIPTIGYNI